jgi:hypothetical protein
VSLADGILDSLSSILRADSRSLANTMDSSIKELPDKSIVDRQEWETVSILFPTNSGPDTNLCDYIGFDCKRLGERFLFPEQYDSASKEVRARLAMALKIAAAHAKVPLVERGWDMKRKQMRFECFRSRARGNKRKLEKNASSLEKKTRRSSSKRAPKGKQCVFRFHVYWLPEEKRWCLFGGTRGNCNTHCYHLPMEPSEVQKRLASINSKYNNAKSARDVTKGNAPPTVIGQSLELQTQDTGRGQMGNDHKELTEFPACQTIDSSAQCSLQKMRSGQLFGSNCTCGSSLVPVVHELARPSQQHGTNDGLERGEGGFCDETLDFPVDMEELNYFPEKVDESPYMHNLHLYQEMARLASFDQEAAELMTKLMREALEKMRIHVAERAGDAHFTDSRIRKERERHELRSSSYGPSEGSISSILPKKKRKDPPI